MRAVAPAAATLVALRREVGRLLELRATCGASTRFAYVTAHKGVTRNELYGYISMATREWKDGLLSKVMRDLGQIDDEKPKWMILDGDLDANWIENMNSVMDDNRLLTLASNERIRLLGNMKLLFEIRDLLYASPATVTRAGVLFISDELSLIHI